MSDAADRRGRPASLGVGADHAAASRIAALERIVEQYRVLLETSAAITTSTDLAETLGLITSLVTERLDVAWCDLYDYEAAADEFVVIAFYQLPELRIDSSEWIGTRYDSRKWSDLAACVRERRPSISYRDDPDLPAGELADMDEWEELSNMRLPLVYRGAVMGLIDVGESRQMRRWTEDDKRVLQAIANQAAIAIANARAYARLEELVTTDGLTGLSNRRCLTDCLRQDVTEALRYGQDLSLLMLDVDDFKAFNDRYGHAQGDRVLAEVAQILREGTRADVDMAARYGGEEFAVVMPHTPPTGDGPETAMDVAERLRAAVATHPFEGWSGRRGVKVTVSIGVAGVRAAPAADGDGAEDLRAEGARFVALAADRLVTDADEALYLAKQRGKDRVCTFEA